MQVLLPYAEALAVVFLMADVHLANEAFLQGGARYTLLLIGVAYGVWRGGKGPALVALAGSCFLGAYAFSPPQFSLQITNRSDQIVLLLYLIVGLVITVLGEAQRVERRKVLAREKELREAYAQLATANASLKELADRRAADLAELRRFVAEEKI